MWWQWRRRDGKMGKMGKKGRMRRGRRGRRMKERGMRGSKGSKARGGEKGEAMVGGYEDLGVCHLSVAMGVLRFLGVGGEEEE